MERQRKGSGLKAEKNARSFGKKKVYGLGEGKTGGLEKSKEIKRKRRVEKFGTQEKKERGGGIKQQRRKNTKESHRMVVVIVNAPQETNHRMVVVILNAPQETNQRMVVVIVNAPPGDQPQDGGCDP